MCYGSKIGFTVCNLMLMASTEEAPVSLGSVRVYVKVLNRVRLFIVRGKDAAATYRLKTSANTGPNTPKILRSKMVYDANTETIFMNDLLFSTKIQTAWNNGTPDWMCELAALTGTNHRLSAEQSG